MMLLSSKESTGRNCRNHTPGNFPRGSSQQEARESCSWRPEASTDAPASAYPVVLLRQVHHA